MSGPNTSYDPVEVAALDPKAVDAREHGRLEERPFETAVATGAEVLHEPRVWPEYHPSYYGTFVRDPDGNNVEAVCHRPE